MDVYERPAGVLAIISGPRWWRGENSNSKALALGHQALSGARLAPVIIPTFGGMRSVLIRCKGAAKQFLVALQMRIKKQVAHAAAARLWVWWNNELPWDPRPLWAGQILYPRATLGRKGPAASCHVEKTHDIDPRRPDVKVPLLPPPYPHFTQSVFLKCAFTPREQKHTVGFPLKASSEVIIPSPQTSLDRIDSDWAVPIPTVVCRRACKRRETVEGRQTPAGSHNWVAPVSFARRLGVQPKPSFVFTPLLRGAAANFEMITLVTFLVLTEVFQYHSNRCLFLNKKKSL